MEKFTYKFNNDEYPYAITIGPEGVIVHGCDCEDKMIDEIVKQVHAHLGEYLKFRGING